MLPVETTLSEEAVGFFPLPDFDNAWRVCQISHLADLAVGETEERHSVSRLSCCLSNLRSFDTAAC